MQCLDVCLSSKDFVCPVGNLQNKLKNGIQAKCFIIDN